MATTINEIIRDALEQIKAEHLNLTPDNYAKVFCKVAKQKGVIVEDCQKVDKYIKKLDIGGIIINPDQVKIKKVGGS